MQGAEIDLPSRIIAIADVFQALTQARSYRGSMSFTEVMLSDFYDPGMYQPVLFDEVSCRVNSQKLMSVLDTINRNGAGKVFFAGQGVKKDWSMKREHLSPAYTMR